VRQVRNKLCVGAHSSSVRRSATQAAARARGPARFFARSAMSSSDRFGLLTPIWVASARREG